MTDPTKHLIGCWAEEGGIQIHILAGDNESRVIEIVDMSGKVLASATVASFRRQRLANALAMEEGADG